MALSLELIDTFLGGSIETPFQYPVHNFHRNSMPRCGSPALHGVKRN